MEPSSQVLNIPELVNIIIQFIINGNVYPVSLSNSIPHNMCNFAMINTVTANVMRELSYKLPCDDVTTLYNKLVYNCMHDSDDRIHMKISELCGYKIISDNKFHYYRGNKLYTALNNRIIDISRYIHLHQYVKTYDIIHILEHINVQFVSGLVNLSDPLLFLYEENCVNVVIKNNISLSLRNLGGDDCVRYSDNCLYLNIIGLGCHRILFGGSIRFPLITKLVVKSSDIILCDNFLDIFPNLAEFVVDCNYSCYERIKDLASKYNVVFTHQMSDVSC